MVSVICLKQATSNEFKAKYVQHVDVIKLFVSVDLRPRLSACSCDLYNSHTDLLADYF